MADFSSAFNKPKYNSRVNNPFIEEEEEESKFSPSIENYLSNTKIDQGLFNRSLADNNPQFESGFGQREDLKLISALDDDGLDFSTVAREQEQYTAEKRARTEVRNSQRFFAAHGLTETYEEEVAEQRESFGIQNALDPIFDFLSIGNYSTAAAAEELLVNGDVYSAFEQAGIEIANSLGLEEVFDVQDRVRRTTWSDVLTGKRGDSVLSEFYSTTLDVDAVDDDWEAATLGFLMDVFLDPTTYFGYGLIKGVRGLKHLDGVAGKAVNKTKASSIVTDSAFGRGFRKKFIPDSLIKGLYDDRNAQDIVNVINDLHADDTDWVPLEIGDVKEGVEEFVVNNLQKEIGIQRNLKALSETVHHTMKNLNAGELRLIGTYLDQAQLIKTADGYTTGGRLGGLIDELQISDAKKEEIKTVVVPTFKNVFDDIFENEEVLDLLDASQFRTNYVTGLMPQGVFSNNIVKKIFDIKFGDLAEDMQKANLEGIVSTSGEHGMMHSSFAKKYPTLESRLNDGVATETNVAVIASRRGHDSIHKVATQKLHDTVFKDSRISIAIDQDIAEDAGHALHKTLLDHGMRIYKAPTLSLNKKMLQKSGEDQMYYAMPAPLVEKLEDATRMFNGKNEEGWDKLMSSYRQVQGLWKAYALMSPGYHARNVFSNVFNNLIAGVNNPIYYAQAMLVQVEDTANISNRAVRSTVEKLLGGRKTIDDFQITLGDNKTKISLKQAKEELESRGVDSGGFIHHEADLSKPQKLSSFMGSESLMGDLLTTFDGRKGRPSQTAINEGLKDWGSTEERISTIGSSLYKAMREINADVSEETANQTAEIFDIIARSWAWENYKTPDDWYAENINEIRAISSESLKSDPNNVIKNVFNQMPSRYRLGKNKLILTDDNLDTPEFRAFFGDSVLRYEDGTPIRMKHGSPHMGDIELLYRGGGIYGKGIYVTEDIVGRDEARQALVTAGYAKKIFSEDIKIPTMTFKGDRSPEETLKILNKLELESYAPRFTLNKLKNKDKKIKDRLLMFSEGKRDVQILSKDPLTFEDTDVLTTPWDDEAGDLDLSGEGIINAWKVIENKYKKINATLESGSQDKEDLEKFVASLIKEAKGNITTYGSLRQKKGTTNRKEWVPKWLESGSPEGDEAFNDLFTTSPDLKDVFKTVNEDLKEFPLSYGRTIKTIKDFLTTDYTSTQQYGGIPSWQTSEVSQKFREEVASDLNPIISKERKALTKPSGSGRGYQRTIDQVQFQHADRMAQKSTLDILEDVDNIYSEEVKELAKKGDPDAIDQYLKEQYETFSGKEFFVNIVNRAIKRSTDEEVWNFFQKLNEATSREIPRRSGGEQITVAPLAKRFEFYKDNDGNDKIRLVEGEVKEATKLEPTWRMSDPKITFPKKESWLDADLFMYGFIDALNAFHPTALSKKEVRAGKLGPSLDVLDFLYQSSDEHFNPSFVREVMGEKWYTDNKHQVNEKLEDEITNYINELKALFGLQGISQAKKFTNKLRASDIYEGPNTPLGVIDTYVSMENPFIINTKRLTQEQRDVTVPRRYLERNLLIDKDKHKDSGIPASWTKSELKELEGRFNDNIVDDHAVKIWNTLTDLSNGSFETVNLEDMYLALQTLTTGNKVSYNRYFNDKADLSDYIDYDIDALLDDDYSKNTYHNAVGGKMNRPQSHFFYNQGNSSTVEGYQSHMRSGGRNGSVSKEGFYETPIVLKKAIYEKFIKPFKKNFEDTLKKDMQFDEDHLIQQNWSDSNIMQTDYIPRSSGNQYDLQQLIDDKIFVKKDGSELTPDELFDELYTEQAIRTKETFDIPNARAKEKKKDFISKDVHPISEDAEGMVRDEDVWFQVNQSAPYNASKNTTTPVKNKSGIFASRPFWFKDLETGEIGRNVLATGYDVEKRNPRAQFIPNTVLEGRKELEYRAYKAQPNIVEGSSFSGINETLPREGKNKAYTQAMGQGYKRMMNVDKLIDEFTPDDAQLQSLSPVQIDEYNDLMNQDELTLLKTLVRSDVNKISDNMAMIDAQQDELKKYIDQNIPDDWWKSQGDTKGRDFDALLLGKVEQLTNDFLEDKIQIPLKEKLSNDLAKGKLKDNGYLWFNTTASHLIPEKEGLERTVINNKTGEWLGWKGNFFDELRFRQYDKDPTSDIDKINSEVLEKLKSGEWSEAVTSQELYHKGIKNSFIAMTTETLEDANIFNGASHALGNIKHYADYDYYHATGGNYDPLGVSLSLTNKAYATPHAHKGTQVRDASHQSFSNRKQQLDGFLNTFYRIETTPLGQDPEIIIPELSLVDQFKKVGSQALQKTLRIQEEYDELARLKEEVVEGDPISGTFQRASFPDPKEYEEKTGMSGADYQANVVNIKNKIAEVQVINDAIDSVVNIYRPTSETKNIRENIATHVTKNSPRFMHGNIRSISESIGKPQWYVGETTDRDWRTMGHKYYAERAIKGEDAQADRPYDHLDQINTLLQSVGFDGIMHLGKGGGRRGGGVGSHQVAIAFDMGQVKGHWNSGAYDKSNKDFMNQMVEVYGEGAPKLTAGQIRFLQDGKSKADILVTEVADATTVIHELGHLVRRNMLSSGDKGIIHRWILGDKEYKKAYEDAYKEAEIKLKGTKSRWEIDDVASEILEAKVWTRENEELFAESWEGYFREGITIGPRRGGKPIGNAMQGTFDYMKDQFANIFDLSKEGRRGIKVNDEVRLEFQKLLGRGKDPYPEKLETAKAVLGADVDATEGFVEKAHRLMGDNWAVTGNRAFGRTLEDNSRIAHFLAMIQRDVGTLEGNGLLNKKKAGRGMSYDDAAQSVNRVLIDYGDLTPFERDVMKTIMPFYTWMRKNIPLQVQQMAYHPTKYAMIPKMQNALEDLSADFESIDEPDYFDYTTAVRMPFMSEDIPLQRGGMPVYIAPDLPYGDLNRLNMKDMVSSMTPFLKTWVEIYMPSGYNFFLDSKIESYKDQPVSVEYGDTKIDLDKIGIENQKTAYALQTLLPPVGKALRLVERAGEGRLGEQLSRELFGLGVITTDVDAIQRSKLFQKRDVSRALKKRLEEKFRLLGGLEEAIEAVKKD